MTGTLVLPTMTAPAALRRETTTASCVTGMCSVPATPHVVGSPATLKASLTVTGRPSSGRSSPLASAASAPRAASRARSKSRTTTALILPSFDSMRRIVCSSSSLAEIFRARNAATSSLAVRYSIPSLLPEVSERPSVFLGGRHNASRKSRLDRDCGGGRARGKSGSSRPGWRDRVPTHIPGREPGGIEAR